MKKAQKLSEIAAEMANQVNLMRHMVDQVSAFGAHISRINDNLVKYGLHLDMPEKHPPEKPAIEAVSTPMKPRGTAAYAIAADRKFGWASNIIPFPGRGRYLAQGREPVASTAKPILAAPGMQLPDGIHDFRSALQRDGLILIAWDKRMSEMGERYTAYWVTSMGIPRFYASRKLSYDDFPSAMPDHKSYAAEDGIEFFGQKAPLCLVHVAPELMMSNPRHGELRKAHIETLAFHGSKANYDYRYLLTKEKRKNLPCKNIGNRRSGTLNPA